MVTVVGVPLITHVELSIDNPAESVGELEQAVIAAPFIARLLGVTLIEEFISPEVPVDKR